MKNKEALLIHATETLATAQNLCAKASAELLEARNQIRHTGNQYKAIQFQLSCILQQQNLLENKILKFKIGDQLINKEWKADFFVHLAESLEKWQSQLQLKFERLQATPYDIDSTHDNLSDFIEPESLDTVQQRISEFGTMQGEVSKIDTLYNKLLVKIQTKLSEKKIKKLVRKIEQRYPSNYLLTCNVFEDEMNGLELELTEFLNSITDHFDKCQILSKEYDHDLYEIVLVDDLKIEEITESLSEITAEVTDLAQSALSYLTKYDDVVPVDSLKILIRSIIDEFIKLETQLNIFSNVRTVIAKYKESAINDIEGIKMLCQHYDNFLKSYSNLLKEITRRTKLANEMNSMMKETQERLEKLHEQDLKKRERFLKENGDSLPQDIWEPEINSFDPLYKISYSTKKF